MQLVSLKDMAVDTKVALLVELGYNSDGKFVIDKEGNKILDRYLDVHVEVENMIILPGSTIILDNNELSVSKYIEEFGDVF